MRSKRALFLAVLGLIWLGCETLSKPTLRIGITESAGANVLYLADAADIYCAHGADVRVVELAGNEALERAFRARDIDAVVLPLSRALQLIRRPQSDAGVLLILAIPKSTDESSRWQTEEEEILLVRRAEVMQRRSDWSMLLAAYEHALMIRMSRPDSVVALIAMREHRSTADVARDISWWDFFGLSEQDSLLNARREFSNLDARWQGNLGFASHKRSDRGDPSGATKSADQMHSR